MNSFLKRRPWRAAGQPDRPVPLARGVSFGLATGAIASREIKNNTLRSEDIRNNLASRRDMRNSLLLAQTSLRANCRVDHRGRKAVSGHKGLSGSRAAGAAGPEQLVYRKG